MLWDKITKLFLILSLVIGGCLLTMKDEMAIGGILLFWAFVFTIIYSIPGPEK